MAQLKQVITQLAFSSPILGFEVPDAAALNAALTSDIAKRQQAEPGLSISNQHGWHSDRDLFKREEHSFKLLCSHIVRALIHVGKTFTPEFSLQQRDIQGQGWVNVNNKGAYNAPHDHGSFHWSGCYYVAVPPTANERSGNIEFLDPRGGLSMGSDAPSPIFGGKVRFRPQPGLMLIFPSYLYHWVYPNEEAADRISIAFNAKIVSRPKAGEPRT